MAITYSDNKNNLHTELLFHLNKTNIFEYKQYCLHGHPQLNVFYNI